MRLTGHDDSTPCEVLGDLRVPVSATAAAPAVALLSTNGFGGSKDDDGTQGNRSFAEQYAGRGCVTLSCSGLGVGGSLLQLAAPEWDGKVADRAGLATCWECPRWCGPTRRSRSARRPA